ncbi:hypothetical protein PQ459_07100 [Chryseobacterium sp. KACC 21268]|nr:hypothetical protein PQ459_07100 [Chryseobacterium sp. KACC 21268]
MMKKTILIFSIFVTFQNYKSQVAISKAPNSTGAILDFATGTTNGLILSAVTSLPTSPSNGTFLVDRSDLKVKMRQNNTWVDMTNPGDLSKIAQNTSSEVGNGVIIGSNSSSASGVLVLEATNKALVLPKIASPQTNVRSPYPGMICYDTTSKSVAVFDGKVWNFWR